MAKFTIRIDDEDMALVERLAQDNGQSRSAWIKSAIHSAMKRQADDYSGLPQKPAQKTARISVRIPVGEIQTIHNVAGHAGMSRHEWLKRTIHWALWDRAGRLRLCPSSITEIQKISGQVRQIGISLNQAVKAVNAAAKPDASIPIQDAARSVIAMEEIIAECIREARTELIGAAWGEVEYWTNAPSRLRTNRDRVAQ